MGHQHISNRIRVVALMIACSAGISFAADSAQPTGGGAHAAAPSGTVAPSGGTPAPAAPVHAGPGANPTTPAGTAPKPTPERVVQRPLNQTPAASTDNGADHEHHHRERNQPQYQTLYGNFWYPNEQWYGEYGNTGNGNTAPNNNYSTNNDAAQPAPAPTPTPVTPPDNSTSLAAQADNAVNHSPEIVSINNEVQRAQAAVAADRQRVISQLANQPEYQQAVARQKDATKDLRDAKPATPVVNPTPAVMDAAAAKLDASDDVTKMQEAAIAADPQAAADKDKLAKLVSARDAKDAQLRGQH